MASRIVPQFNTRIPTSADKKRARERAIEWMKFRKDHLFTQRRLADNIHCARRTVQAIEAAETLWPTPDLLKRFRDLKQKQELQARRYDERISAAAQTNKQALRQHGIGAVA